MGDLWKCNACDCIRTEQGAVSDGLRAVTIPSKDVIVTPALKAGEHCALFRPYVGVSMHSKEPPAAPRPSAQRHSCRGGFRPPTR